MKEKIHKGATRPAMLLDMPMVPTVGLTTIALVAGVWGLYLTESWWCPVIALLFLAPVLAVMRDTTKRDDQRVMQLTTAVLQNVRHRWNRRTFGCRSYSPLVSDGAKDDWMP